MLHLNFVECSKISAGTKYIELNNGFKLPADNISDKCRNLFQSILPNFIENGRNGYSVALSIHYAGCSTEYAIFKNNAMNVLG